MIEEVNKDSNILTKENHSVIDEYVLIPIDEKARPQDSLNEVRKVRVATDKDLKGKFKSNLMKKYNLDNVVTIDCGKEVYYYNPRENMDESIKITYDELLKLPSKLKNTLIVSESAHMDRPRTLKSFAQPFTAKQLGSFKKLCEKTGNVLRLFPEMQSFNVINENGKEKSDAEDPIALSKYLENHSYIIDSLKKPSESYEPSELKKEAWREKSNLNLLLNYARRKKYGVGDDSDVIQSLLEKHKNEIAGKLSDNAKLVFKLDEVYKSDMKRYNAKKGDVNLNQANMTGIYSICATLWDFDIDPNTFDVRYKPRLREQTNSLPGWKFVSEQLLGFSPFHLKGGIARSNLKFHNFKTFLSNRIKADNNGYTWSGKKLNGKRKFEFNNEERQYFSQVQSDHKKACKELFMVLKQIMQRTYNIQ